MHDSGWYWAEYQGKEGLIPEDYLQPLNDFDESEKWCEVLYDFDAQDDSELSLRYGDVVKLVGNAEFTGWLLGASDAPPSIDSKLGEAEDKQGMFPESYARVMEASELRALNNLFDRYTNVSESAAHRVC